MKKKIRSLFPFILLLLISVLPLVPFFQKGLLVTHDGKDHVVRIASFYASLLEGNIIPRWSGNLNWGYGHPILMFLYPMTSYTASLFHYLGLSFIDSTKAVFIVAYIASLFTMYLWMQSVWGKRVGLLGAILYGFAPYRFVDLYVRGAIGEHMAFVFPPLILYFLYIISERTPIQTRYDRLMYYFQCVGLSVSFACFVLSHNAISLMFLPVIGWYMIFLFLSGRRWSFAFVSSIFLLLGFGLSAFFWIPALIEGKYTLRYILTSGEPMNRFVPFQWFFYSPWSYGGTALLTKFLGFIHWFGVFVSGIVIWKSKDTKKRILLIFSFIMLIAALFIMTSASKFIWMNVKILQNFQFPWRFLSLTTFITAVIGGVSITFFIEMISVYISQRMDVLQRKEKLIKNIFFISFCLISIGVTFHMWKPRDILVTDESIYTGIYPGTTDTGESSPIWSIRFMEHTPANPIEVAEGEATIIQGNRTSTVHEYKIHAKQRSRIVENTLYFPGWKIFVDGFTAGIQFQDPTYRGLMTFRIDEGEHTVRVVFTDTKLRMWSNMISLMSLITILVFGILFFVWKRIK